MAKQASTTSNDERIMMTFLKLMGVGFVVIISFIFVFNYNRSNEYPELLSKDSLNDVVLSVKKDRGTSYVTFEEKKYQIPRAKNFRYEDFPSLSEVISIGDVILKKAFSDTITVRHSGKEYVYLLR
jgi:hypothetical protein